VTPHALLAPARLAGQPVLRSQTDERLVDLVRAGHDAAFEAIVGRYRRPLLRYCGGILSGERAEDAVQQTFVKAYEAMRRDDSPLNLKPWLYRIAHNTALNGLRDRSLKHEPLDPQLDGVERPDQASERRQGIRDVLAAVQELPTRQRDAIVLRELEGRSYEEIAGALGVTGGAVRQLLSRARTSLRAAATALTPIGLLVRIPFAAGDTGVNDRVAEMVGGAGVAAMATKLGTAVLVTGAVAGGVAAVPALKDDQDPRAKQSAAEQPASDNLGPGGAGPAGAIAPVEDRRLGNGRGRGRDDRRGHGRGRGKRGPGDDHGGRSGGGHGGDDHGGRAREPGDSHGGTDDHGGRSGSDGGGDDRTRSHSGPGSGGETTSGGEDSSGPGPGSGGGEDLTSGSGGSGSGGGDNSGPGGGSDDPLEVPEVPHD
jgi:RNA polymerase sigma factor (sigma-70 family)